MMGENR
ncbi:hypothetical protein BsWGS_20039 [Bradybaena similaris]